MSEDTRDSATCGDSLLPKISPSPPEPQVDTTGLDDVVDEKMALASPDTKAEVKFVSADSQNGDAIIDIDNVRAAFSGMGKEELMKFANDPFWVRTRWVLFIGFWVLWIAMVAGAIAIIVLAPKCAPPKPRRWWEQSALYSVDSLSSDGTNDLSKLEGLEKFLSNLNKIGADAVILPPIMNTGSSNNPESVTDFKAINPSFGTLDNLKTALENLGKKGVHVILEIAAGHTSKKHEWFKKSAQNDERYKDYYIWVNSTIKDKYSPLNKWGQDWSQGAFVWNDQRGAFYLRQSSADLPVLNLTNPNIIAEFNDIMKFWLDHAASGFQIRHASNILAIDRITHPTSGNITGSNYTSSISAVKNLHSIVTNHTEDNVVILHGDVKLPSDGDKVFGYGDVLNTPDSLFSLPDGFTAEQLKNIIELPVNESNKKWPVWDVSVNQVKSSTLPPGLIDGLFMTSMLLPGTPIIHHGSLFDLANVNMSSVTDAVSDGTERKTAHQNRAELFKALASVRKNMDAFNFGSTNITIVNGTDDVSVLTFTRIKSGNPGLLVVLNPSSKKTVVNLAEVDKVPEELTVNSVSYLPEGNNSLQPKSKLSSNQVKLPEKSAVVFSFVPKKEG